MTILTFAKVQSAGRSPVHYRMILFGSATDFFFFFVPTLFNISSYPNLQLDNFKNKLREALQHCNVV